MTARVTPGDRLVARATLALAALAAAATLLAIGLGVDPALACATCIDSAYGDRGFNRAFVGLMLAPFAVAGGLGAMLAWYGRDRKRRGDSADRVGGNTGPAPPASEGESSGAS